MRPAEIAGVTPPRQQPWDLERLYAEHGAFVHGFVRRLLGPGNDAEDVTQEVFLVALRKLPHFAGATPSSWLVQITLKVVRNTRRNSRIRRALSWAIPRRDPVDTRTPEQEASAREETRALYAALDRLSEAVRTVFILYEIEGLGCAEIAGLIGCPVGTVYRRLHHARQTISAHFDALPNGGRAGATQVPHD